MPRPISANASSTNSRTERVSPVAAPGLPQKQFNADKPNTLLWTGP
jgi:hypothetical protein